MSPLLRSKGALRRKRATVERPLRDSDYSAYPRSLTAGNLVTPLQDGAEGFPSMLDAISSASRYVHLETYILEEDTMGRTFARVLIEAAGRGAEVRLIYDGLGGFGLSADFRFALRDAGVRVAEYRPLSLMRRRWSRRDHRKILVVDGKVGFAGGLNIADDYAPLDVGGAGWRDTHCRVEGPVVAQLDQMFWRTWHRAKGEPYPLCPPLPFEERPGRSLAQAIGSDHWGQRMAIRRHYLHAIRTATDYIYIANAYFVPDPGVRRALIRAARRGVNVNILTSADGDLKTVQFASEASFSRLLRRGVRIHLFSKTNMHAKTAVIDDVWATIGSYNLDYMSLMHNLEVVLEVVDRSVGKTMRAMYEADLRHCDELSLDRWRRRPWWRKLAAWFFYKFKRWF